MVICTRDHHCSFPSLFFFFFVPFPFLGFISGILLDVLHVCINTSNEISCNLYSFCARRLYTFIMLLWWFIIWDWHDAMWWFLVEDINNITSHSTPKEMYIILDSAVYIVLFFLNCVSAYSWFHHGNVYPWGFLYLLAKNFWHMLIYPIVNVNLRWWNSINRCFSECHEFLITQLSKLIL